MDIQEGIETLTKLIKIRSILFSEDFETAKRRAGEMIEIVGDFGGVLEKLDSVKVGTGNISLPESLLPYDRETIKEALRHTLLCAANEAFRNHIHIGYQALVSFVPDEEYEKANKLAEMLSGLASGKPLTSEELDILTSAKDTLEKVTKGMDETEKELEHWLEKTKRKLAETVTSPQVSSPTVEGAKSSEDSSLERKADIEAMKDTLAGASPEKED